MKKSEKYLASSEKSKVKFAKECPAVRTDRGLTGKERLQTSHLTWTEAGSQLCRFLLLTKIDSGF